MEYEDEDPAEDCPDEGVEEHPVPSGKAQRSCEGPPCGAATEDSPGVQEVCCELREPFDRGEGTRAPSRARVAPIRCAGVRGQTVRQLRPEFLRRAALEFFEATVGSEVDDAIQRWQRRSRDRASPPRGRFRRWLPDP